jgi:hypothetical protein
MAAFRFRKGTTHRNGTTRLGTFWINSCRDVRLDEGSTVVAVWFALGGLSVPHEGA